MPATASDSYATGSVTGNYICWRSGGMELCFGHSKQLLRHGQRDWQCDMSAAWWETISGTVLNSFWDTETSGHNTSAGGTGRNTTEMHDIDTFSGAAWNITAVGSPGERNIAYIWNIVDDVTYPFLSWQP